MRLKIIPLILLLAASLFSATASRAISFDTLSQPVVVKAYSSLDKVPQGGEVKIALELTLQPHWHVNAHKVNEDYLIPTSVEIRPPAGVEVVEIAYPTPLEKKLSFSEKPMLLYEEKAAIGVLLRVASDVEVGELSVGATVTYQACDNEKCLAPVEERLAIPIVVSSPTEAIDVTNIDVFRSITFTGSSTASTTSGGRLAGIVASKGYFVAFLLVFLWGLALNLTPCVYPIIPITVGYFGGQSAGKPSQTLVLALVYVLGMAIMYSTLGLFAALTGGLLGTALQSPIVTILVALVLVTLSLSMFGVYEIRVPARLSNIAGASSGRGGAVGALFMGLTVGIVAAPCIGPFVLALLTFVGKSGNPALGFSLFFTLALGLGFPFVFLALASGSISKLPKSGEWMEWIKKVFGLVMLGMAVFFLDPLLSDPVYWGLLGALFVLGGILLGFVLKTQATSLSFQVLKRFVGIAAPLFGLYLLLAPGHIIARGTADGGIVWEDFDDDLLAGAKTKNQYVVIDFSAEWCLPCKELDHRTFTVPEVVDATAEFVRLKADLTLSSSDEVAALRKKFAIRGVPTVIFLDQNGKERTDLRIFGFVDGDEFLKRLDKLTGGT